STFGGREHFFGAIDEVRVYNQFLDANEIEAIYNSEKPAGGASQVGYFPWSVDANDYSGNAYNGTLLGGASVSGTLMTGFNAEDAATVPAEMMHGLGDFTVTTYVNFSQLNTGGGFPNNTYLSGANSSTDNALDLFYDKNFNSWRIGLNGVFTDGQFFDDQVFENTWYHVAYSRLGGEVTVYVDGNPRGTVFVNDQLLNIETGGLIFGQEQDNVGGGFQADQSLNGQLSETRIFSSALSQAEVQQLAVQDAPVPPLAVSNVQAKVFGPTAVNLSWTDNSDNESGFDIQVNVGGSQFAYMEVPANSNVIFISGLETGLQYEFIVIAKNGFGTNVTPESLTYATPIQLITPIVTVEPVAFSLDDAITITAYPDRMYPVGDLVNEDRIYMHSGLVLAGNENQGGWTAAPGDFWGTDSGIGEMTRNPDGSFSITIQDPRSYYGAVDTLDYAQIGLLFRNVEGSRIGLSGYNPTAGTQDIFIDLFDSEDIQKPEGRFATFNGVDYLDLSLNTEAATPTVFTSPTTFTIEGWINLTSLPESAGASLFGRISNSKDVVDLEIYHNSGTSYSLDFGIGEASGAGIINWYTYELPQPEQLVGNWNHVAAVYDNGAIRVYLNGDLVREGSASPLVGVGLGTDDLIYAGAGLNGKIDELRFWNQAQSASEIRSKIGVTLSGNDSGLAGHWPMDDLFNDGDGLGAYTPDLTSNGNKLYTTGEQVVFNALPDIIGEVTAANGTGIYDGAEFLIGNTNNVEYRITNNVDADTTASGTLTTLFYLSTDFVLDGLDQLIGSDQQTLNNLVQGQSTSFNALVDIPGGINPGNYVLLIAADAYNEIDEVDDNNLFGYNITLIDLQPYVINSVTLQEATAESLTFNWSYNNPSDNSGVSYEWQLISGDFTTIIATGSTNETTATVSGLAYNTTYNFSVKALASGDSRQSLFETIQVMTLNDEEDPIVINISANENTDPAVEQTATIFASDEISGVSRVEISTRNSSTSDFELKGNAVEVNVNGTTKEYTYTIPADDIPVGSLAVQIQAIAYDNAGRMSNPVTKNISINQQSTTDIVDIDNPDIEAGGTGITDYTIFAFPYKAKSLRSIITADQVRENWVIEEWTGFTYNDYPNDLEYGKGYWIIVNDASILPINFSGVESAPITGDQGYEIELNANWTLIGNPSTVGSLNWGTVLQHNVDRGFITSTNSVDQLYVYTGTGSTNGYTTTNSLRTYQGAFVKNETGSPLTLEIPINAIQGARVEQAIAAPRDYMQPEGGWEIVMDMNAENKVVYGISGFGMHPSAVNGKDNWDMSTPILFNEYLKAEFTEHELEGKAVARSIHAPAFNDVWTTEISTHLPKGTVVRIDFNGNPLLKEGQELVMFDPQTGMTQRVDENASYSFTYEENYKLTFVLGDHVFIDEQTQINKVFVNQLYPNPSQGEFMLSVAVPTEFMKYELRVKVTDLAGRTLHQVPFVPGSSGLQHVNLDVRALGLQSGLYLFEIEVRDIENAANNYKITKKGYLINR
ncbi:MAG: LamG-like jellyroll fold domain-containing protein, partial [Cyclobacteriaceae bacterium]